MLKIIKKIAKAFHRLFITLTLIMLGLLVLFFLPPVQSFIINTGLTKLQLFLGNQVQYESVKLRPINKIVFENILIEDLTGDTLVYAPYLKASFPGLVRKVVFDKDAHVALGSLHFEDAYFRLYSDSSNTINLQFIVDAIEANKDTNKVKKPFEIREIDIRNSRFALIDYDTLFKAPEIDFSRLTLDTMDILVRNLRTFADTLGMDIHHLSFMERSGFQVHKLEGKMHLCRGQLYFDDITVKTPRSDIDAKQIHFDFKVFKDFGQGGVFNKVRLDFLLNPSMVDLSDIGYFSDVFYNTYQKVNFSGKVYGRIANLKGRELDLKFGRKSNLIGKFDIMGLPNAQETFLVFDLKELNTNSSDINSLSLPKGLRINLPERFKEVTDVRYAGNFTGFFNDFVSYGKLQTNLGDVFTDISFVPDSNDFVTFSGRIRTDSLYVGKLVGEKELIEDIAFDFKIDGRGTIDQSFLVDMDGNINYLVLNDYKYRNIKVDGALAESLFNGEFTIDDPNAMIDFEGIVDMSSKIRKYNFTANVNRSNLYKLNLTDEDPNYGASFMVRANITGNEIDNLNGNLRLLNSLFYKTGKQIQVYDLNLDLVNDSSSNKISIQSDLLDAELVGEYRISELADEFIQVVNEHLPSLSLSPSGSFKDEMCQFGFNVRMKHTAPFFDFFLPDFDIASHTFLEGDFERNGHNLFNLHVESKGIRVHQTSIENVILNLSKEDSLINLSGGCEKLNLSERLDFENVTLNTLIGRNQIDFASRWLNWDSSLYKGAINGRFDLLNPAGEKMAAIASIDSSQIIISDTIWTVHPCKLYFDSAMVDVQDFRMSHNKEYFYANGLMSDQVDTNLYVRFNDFNLQHLNFFTRSESFDFEGMLNGEATIQGFRQPLFISSIEATNFKVNQQLIGNCLVESSWDPLRDALKVHAIANRGKLKTLLLKGNYYPLQNNAIDFRIELDKFKLDFVNPYMAGIFSDIRGFATGAADLTGSFSRPSLNGNVQLQKAAFTIDYLKTRYNFTTNIEIFNNNIVFDNTRVYDTDGNHAVVNGMIRTAYFKDIDLNLNLNADNLLCLNTTQNDNSDYYGTAYTSGLVRINGKPSEMKIEVNARSGKGTRFFIPLTGSEELSEYNFITYMDESESDTEEEKEEYKVDLSGMQLDFNLSLTPDAEVQIIFDPTMGDIIKGYGSGDMKISINTLGDFKIIGEYVIDEGDYLFTLQDVINKKFKVEPGSSLRWSGDPVNANLDVAAFYRTKASLSDLGTSIGGYETVSSTPDGGAYASRVTVDCKLFLKGLLLKPDIEYELYLPHAEQKERDLVDSKIATDEDKVKQFLSLLVLNRFSAPAGGVSNSSNESNIAGVNASELLSNQLSNWLSQISNDVDIGVNYRPGTKISSSEVEVALSTQLLNDRLNINGSVDVRTEGDAQQANSVVGDVDVDYKINKSGKLRFRAFNRSNDAALTERSPYTQGIGVFYTEEFNTFGEVFKRYMNAITGKGKNDNRQNREARKEEEDEIEGQ